MRKIQHINIIVVTIAIITCNCSVFAQHKKIVKDTLSIEKNDRNVMLNASNNVGPRNVNMGLPASLGGTTILQNGMPVVFHFWPEMPTTCWRQDATITKTMLSNMSESALDAGVVGYSVSTYDNVGTDKFKGNCYLNSNHFGLLRESFNLSGPIANGYKYSIGTYINLDPGTFNPKGYTKYYADNTKLFKFGITKDYNSSLGKGSITLFYRFANSKSLQTSYSAPYLYGANGKVSEIDGFKIGTNSYLQNAGDVYIKDAFTGVINCINPIDNYKAVSHSFDLLWKNTFNSGLYTNFDFRFRYSNVGIFSPTLSGISKADNNYTYLDGTSYKGNYVQNCVLLNTKRTPIRTTFAKFELGKKGSKHDWSVGLHEWRYDVHKYVTESTYYYQEVAANPSIVIPKNATGYQNGFHNFNSIMEYHDGNMNKLALVLKDNWNITNRFNLKAGMRMEWLALRGHYIKSEDRKSGSLEGCPLTNIKNDWLNKTITFNGIYKITSELGVLADAMYTEQGGILGNYNTGTTRNIKQSHIPMFDAGIYLNNKYINIVSKINYISRTNYSGNSNFVNPETGLVARTVVGYDVKTMGWTTDAILKPIKYFNLHFLITLQKPEYSNYSGTLNFSDGTTRDYNFNGSIVTGMSKVLLEIDPTLLYKDFTLSFNARYFSKQNANLTNTLTFESHWETFAQANYKLNKYISFNADIVNVLNQRGASGTISGTDLMNKEEASSKEGTVMSGTYIRPFTVEFGVRCNF